MADQTFFDTKISKEGRVVIPAEARRALGVHAGDTVRLLLDGNEVRLMTAKTLAEGIWAANTGTGTDTGAGDAVADVRAARNADRMMDDLSFELQSARTDIRSEDEITGDVLAALGLGE